MKSILKFSFLVNQFSIYRLGLLGRVDIIDLALYDIAKDMFSSSDTKKIILNDRQWTWIAFGSIKDRAPILMIKNKEAIGRRFKKLCEIGIFDRIDPKVTHNKTFFAPGKLFSHVDYYDEKSPPSDFKVDSLSTEEYKGLSTIESNKSPNHLYSTNQESIESGSKDPSSILPLKSEEKKDKEKTLPSGPPERFKAVWDAWNAGAGIRHRNYSKDRVAGLETALGAMSEGEILEAIDFYSRIIVSEHHFFKYKWTLKEFLKRGLDRFTVEADPWNNFKKSKTAGNDSFQEMKRKQMEIYK